MQKRAPVFFMSYKVYFLLLIMMLNGSWVYADEEKAVDAAKRYFYAAVNCERTTFLNSIHPDERVDSKNNHDSVYKAYCSNNFVDSNVTFEPDGCWSKRGSNMTICSVFMEADSTRAVGAKLRFYVGDEEGNGRFYVAIYEKIGL